MSDVVLDQTLVFSPENIQAFVDRWIVHWNSAAISADEPGERNEAEIHVMAYQDIRQQLFGEELNLNGDNLGG